jgi:cytochrome c peroxidase
MNKLNFEIARLIKPKPLALLGFILIAIWLGWNLFSAEQGQQKKYQFKSPLAQLETSFEVTQPLPKFLTLESNKVVLGARLFDDVRLSFDDSISCASCHVLSQGGTDNRYRSVGVKGEVGSVNAPTVLNSGFNFVQFWDGRATSLEEQVDGPVNHPKEMASNWSLVLSKLEKDEGYVSQFNRLYPEGMTVSNIKNAIANFERSLLTPNSRFDKFLRGETAALNVHEINGYELFQSYGCASCHQGINLGGNMYEKMGLMGDYFSDRGSITEADNGRFNVNHNPDSLHEFRVPSLRNVALTAPYFHDGNATTLEQAITIMAKYQLGRAMPADDLNDIAAFLRSLTGELGGKPL